MVPPCRVCMTGHGGFFVYSRIIINGKAYKDIQRNTNTDKGGQRMTAYQRVNIPLYRNRKGKGYETCRNRARRQVE